MGFSRRKNRFWSFEPADRLRVEAAREDALLDVLEPPVELLHEVRAEDAVQPEDARARPSRT